MKNCIFFTFMCFRVCSHHYYSHFRILIPNYFKIVKIFNYVFKNQTLKLIIISIIPYHLLPFIFYLKRKYIYISSFFFKLLLLLVNFHFIDGYC